MKKTLSQNLHDIYNQASFYFGKLLTDECFLDFQGTHHTSSVFAKAVEFTNKSKKAAQRKALDVLVTKTQSGDIAPKPTLNVLIALSKEVAFITSKATPFLSKTINSPLAIGFAVASCGAIIILDDTTRTMFIEQISQVLALFQNDNGKVTMPEQNDNLGDSLGVNAPSPKTPS